MESIPEQDEPISISPDEAFSALGNERRVGILRVLGEAGEPVAFTELRDRVGMRQGEQFNYHLNKLLGHFVEKTADGYTLRTPGSRLVQTVHSGAATDNPVIEPKPIDEDCYHCDEPVSISYAGHLAVFCTSCAGNYEVSALHNQDESDSEAEGPTTGFLGGIELPPAGIEGRSRAELLQVGTTWQTLERLHAAVNVCPRCSSRMDNAIRVCESHDADEESCKTCGKRYAAHHYHTCTNCNYRRYTLLGRMLLPKTELLQFMTDQGLNPIAPASPMAFFSFLDDYEEEITSLEPFEGRYSFSIDGEAISLTIDENLDVLEVSKSD